MLSSTSNYCSKYSVASLPRRIAFIGTPLSGKGTVTRWLARDHGPFPIISTGDLLRKRQNEDSPLGEAIRAMFKDGSNKMLSYC